MSHGDQSYEGNKMDITMEPTGGRMAGVGRGCHGWPPTGGDFSMNSEGLGVSSEDARCIGFLLLL